MGYQILPHKKSEVYEIDLKVNSTLKFTFANMTRSDVRKLNFMKWTLSKNLEIRVCLLFINIFKYNFTYYYIYILAYNRSKAYSLMNWYRFFSKLK